MSILEKLFGVGKNPSSYAYRLKKARELHAQAVKYVTERRNNNDDVIGRGGSIALHGDKFIVDSSGDRIFVCDVVNLELARLMSGDGVVVKGPDDLQGGQVRTITVHFVNYIK
jgi:hypothetical protein